MILIDTNVLLSLIDPRDPAHTSCIAQLARIQREPLATTTVVIAEACYLMRKHPQMIDRLHRWLEAASVSTTPEAESPATRADAFAWMKRYQDHKPDFADAQLVTLAARIPTAKVWTNDSEFTQIWRLPNGKPVPLLK